MFMPRQTFPRSGRSNSYRVIQFSNCMKQHELHFLTAAIWTYLGLLFGWAMKPDSLPLGANTAPVKMWHITNSGSFGVCYKVSTRVFTSSLWDQRWQKKEIQRAPSQMNLLHLQNSSLLKYAHAGVFDQWWCCRVMFWWANPPSVRTSDAYTHSKVCLSAA